MVASHIKALRQLLTKDQRMPERCSHFTGKDIVSPGEVVSKIKAAIDRAGRYIEAGADVIFEEAPESLEDTRRIAPFAEREHLVGKPVSDAMARRYALADAQP